MLVLRDTLARNHLRLTIELSLKDPDHSRCLQAHRQSPSPRHLRKRARSQGPLLRRHYPASMLLRPCPTPARAAACRDVEAATLARDGSPPITRITFPTCRAHYPGGSSGCACRLLPHSCSLPQMAGGSASALSLSRPAQASLALRPAGSLSRPEATFVTRLQPLRLPARAARQLPDQSTTLRVESSSTGDPRLRGARRVEDGRGSLGRLATPRFPSPLIKPDVRISRIRLSDRFHREAHDVSPVTRGACAAGSSIFASRHSSFGQVRPLQVFAGQRPITLTSPSSRAHQKSGPFPPPALPGFIGYTTLSDSRWHRRPSRR
jgi:hypothetical protein